MDGHVQHDGFGRDINYLRIAVTDKCNFRCIYCMPADGVAPRAHDELLSAEEIARFVRLVAGEGIRRVRLTGQHLARHARPYALWKDHAPGSTRADHGWHRRGAGLGL